MNQKTAWLFRQKAQAAMQSSEQHPLENEVHVDEFEIGTPKKVSKEEVKVPRKSELFWLSNIEKGKLVGPTPRSLKTIAANHRK